MTTDNKKIDKLINESGNSFNIEISKFLREKGWKVIISPYYTDSITEKPREIDIIAEKSFNTLNDFGRPHGTINLQLHIECKYINDSTVFWFDEPEYNKFYPKIAQNIGYNDNPDLKSGLAALATNHHYLKKNEVAKLYSSNSSVKNEQEVMFKAINQSLSSNIYFRKRGSIFDNNYNLKFLTTYPIIICKNFDNFFRANDKSSINDDFILEVNYAYKEDNRDKDEYFLIDIVNFANFDKYLDNLEKYEISCIKTFLS